MSSKQCPFCSPQPERVRFSDEIGYIMDDGFPISAGHSLVIPHTHYASLFDISTPDQQHLFSLINTAKQIISRTYSPDGFNIGINDGQAAGQTVPHLHIHVIPRYEGDVEDPRGGVRWVVPSKARYWT